MCDLIVPLLALYLPANGFGRKRTHHGADGVGLAMFFCACDVFFSIHQMAFRASGVPFAQPTHAVIKNLVEKGAEIREPTLLAK